MPLTPLVKVITYAFLVSTMLSIGLTVTGRDIVQSLRDRRLMLKSLIANLVIVPLLGVAIVTIFQLPADITIGILLLSIAPGGLAAIQFTSKVRESISFAASLLFVLTVIAILLTPIVANLLLPIEASVSLPYGKVILAVLVLVLLPLLVGFAIQHVSAKVAHVLGKPVSLLGTLAFIATVVLTLAMKQEATKAIGGRAVAAMLILVLASMVVGWAMGGPDGGTRRVLATGTSMRNAGLCLLIALKSFPESNVDVAVVAFSSLMVPPNMLFTVYGVLRDRRARKREGSHK